MRLLKRDKQPVWVANEVGFQRYSEPMLLHANVASRRTFVRDDSNLILDDFSITLTLEIKDIEDKGITKTSIFWLDYKRTPDPAVDNATHTVLTLERSPDNAFGTIVLKGLDSWDPLNTPKE
jgi:hypothetical protein